MHEFRSNIYAEADRVHRFRDLVRGRGFCRMPQGTDGFVVEDLDLVVRLYGRKHHSDDTGRLRLIEMKRHGFGRLREAQRRTFGLLDSMCRHSPRYDGFYVVEHSDDRFDRNTGYRVNGVPMTAEEFLAWCSSADSSVPSYFAAVGT